MWINSFFYFYRIGPSNYFCLTVAEGELSPCRHMNGGCGDLCLLTPHGRVNCTCRGERVLLDDNRCVCKSSKCLLILTLETLSTALIDYNGTLHQVAAVFLHRGYAVNADLWFLWIEVYVHKPKSIVTCRLWLNGVCNDSPCHSHYCLQRIML